MTTTFPPSITNPPFIEGPNSGGTYAKNLLVVHVTVSPETVGAARGIVAAWNRTRSGSTQYVVDSKEIIQAVREQAYAWAAGTHANKAGIHVEHVGYIQTLRQWRDGYSTAELALSAQLFAYLAQKYDIPLRRLTVDQIRHAVATGKPADGGICGHSDITKAFPGDTTHTDPGTYFPWDQFMASVKQAAAGNPQEDDMTPDQIANAPIVLQRGKDNLPWPTTVQGALVEIENSIDARADATDKKVDGLAKAVADLTKVVKDAVAQGK